MSFEIVVTETGSPVIAAGNKLVLWDANNNCPVHLDITPENLAAFNLHVETNSSGETVMSETQLLSAKQPAANSENKNLQGQQLIDTSGKKATASWKDDYAVKTLIDEWRGHESYFKSTTITNKKVWEMIARKLKNENSVWDYTGQQCEDKFKDLRKHYIKAKDQNEKSSGLPIATCKFYTEMDEVLGDKPVVKPISVASTLKKHYGFGIKNSSSASSVCVDSNNESDSEHDSTHKSKRKKSITERNIEKLLAKKTEESTKKEEARQKRHIERMERQDRAIDAYERAMKQLLEKL